jgi:nucleoside-diphosphate-sugar epimerase
MKHVVVTGAAGFLGSHLVQSLIGQGHRVTGIDNLSTGLIRNLAGVMENPHFVFHEADVTHPDALDIFLDQQVHEIYHLASPASPKFY